MAVISKYPALLEVNKAVKYQSINQNCAISRLQVARKVPGLLPICRELSYMQPKEEYKLKTHIEPKIPTFTDYYDVEDFISPGNTSTYVMHA